MVKTKKTKKKTRITPTPFERSNDRERKRSHAIDVIGATGTQYIFDTVPERDIIAPDDKEYLFAPEGARNKLVATGRAGACHWVHYDNDGKKHCSYHNKKQRDGSNQFCQWFAYNSYKGNPMQLEDNDDMYDSTQKVINYVKRKRKRNEKKLNNAWWEQTGDHFPGADETNWAEYLDQAIEIAEETPFKQRAEILEIKNDPGFASV